MRRRLALVLLLLLVSPAGADDTASPLTAADRQAFAWFDGLGLPSFKDHPYVQCVEAHAGRGGRIEEDATIGFLVEETPAQWTILKADLWSVRIPRAPDEKTGRIPRLDRLDLRASAMALLAGLRRTLAPGADPEETRRARTFEQMSYRLGEQGRLLGFARALAAHGHDALAHQLLDAARRLPLLDTGERIQGPLEETVGKQMAVSVFWRIVLEFADPQVPRTQLLEELRAFATTYPRSDLLPRARDAASMLEKMVAEDEAHHPPSDEELEALPVEQRVAEWIFRLRDQNGGQYLQPGTPSVFYTQGGAPTPADALVGLGYAAVPGLIDALTDERFTRTVGHENDSTFSHYVARVGDAAREILERITKLGFWNPKDPTSSMVRDQGAEEVQKRYREWWTECSGFLTPLLALAHEQDPVRRAQLARDLPDRGPGTIAGAPERAAWGTGRFLEAAGLTPEGGITLLRLLLTESPHVRTRALAAWALLDLGVDDGVAAMIETWKGLDAEGKVDPLRGEHVAAFLAACRRPEAVQALAEGLDDAPPEVRELVLLAFWDRGLGSVRGLSGDGGGLREPWRLVADAADGAESLVAGRLEDEAEDPLGRIPRQTPIADKMPEYDAGRTLGDLAVRVLHLRWPDAYPMKSANAYTASEWQDMRKLYHDTAAFRSRVH